VAWSSDLSSSLDLESYKAALKSISGIKYLNKWGNKYLPYRVPKVLRACLSSPEAADGEGEYTGLRLRKILIITKVLYSLSLD